MVNLRHCVVLLLLLFGLRAHAQPGGRFDLTGPKIDVRVTRAGLSLPISAVPNLQPGDLLWLHPDLPPTQSVHYLMIAVFLRGTTNPPPDEWFNRIETWNRKVREEGVTITVPEEAEQAVLFLAPETGGDFSTLRSAVKGRPGVFVRASQDLAEAGFEQARIEKYVEEMKQVPPADPAALLEHSNLLARTLALKPNPECFKRPVDQQYSCLTQSGTQTLLDDGHGQTIAQALSNGPASELINQASYTQAAGSGMYSAYVGAIVDLVRLTASLHTAVYQYIPAIAFPKEEELNLRLNTAPSFHNPKSVIVIGLPAVQKSVLPPLRPAEPNHISCLLNPEMVLPVEGAPLVFSTSLAHDLVLHLNLPANSVHPNQPVDIPLVPDAYQGGLVFAPPPGQRHELQIPVTPVKMPTSGAPPSPVQAPTPKPAAAKPAEPLGTIVTGTIVTGTIVTGTIKGMWGFDAFTGPTLPLERDPGTGWHIAASPETQENLVVGRPNHLLLMSTGTACIRNITLEAGSIDGDAKLAWKLKDSGPVTRPEKPDTSTAKASAVPAEPVKTTVQPVEITLNLQHAATPGSIRLAILQYGKTDPDQLGTRTFAEPAHIDSLRLHSGDLTLALTGTSLDQVKFVAIKGQGGKEFAFDPVKQVPPPVDENETSTAPTQDPTRNLTVLLVNDTKAPPLKPNERLTAQVHLQDGRVLDLSTLVLAPRPSVALLSRRVANPTTTAIQMASPDDLPLGSELIFFLKSKAAFPRNEQIEIANADDSLHTTLTVASNALVLQDSHTVLATFDPLKTFGASTFGPFRLRAVAGDGTQGEWLPLATIVRLPTLAGVHCPADPATSCLLSGTGLYLIDAVSVDPDFTLPDKVPEGFVDTTLAIPRPTGPAFYLKLRDDPATVQTVIVPIVTDAPPATATHAHTSGAAHTPSVPPASPTPPDTTATPPARADPKG
jgi:hypothetical protein